MNIGVVTWTLGLTEPGPVVAKVRELGLDALQYAGDFRDCSGIELKEKAAAAGLRILAIDPFNAGPPEPDAASEQGAIAYYCKLVDFAMDAGRVPVTLQGLALWTRNCPDRQSAWQRLLACCNAVDAYARERGVRTLYEVCNHYELPLVNTSEACRGLISQMAGGNLQMILDSFHMNINERDPVATIRRHAPNTGIYHISDSGRGGMGSGHIDFREQCDALLAAGFEGDVAIELVLPHLTPNSPPQTAEDQQMLDAEIIRSAVAWRSYLSQGGGA
ncbi:sugar phosphate isomerase/epimerase [Pseudomonas putida]|uniref:Sugar phosphate isomerase/epimerase n=1 Tax=Pseudomonas putida TaxID=303 RepID=A0A4D6XAG5_PSEPU|nr:sugar phosphate isomerase/epimerase [Pseudomonas putida]QCI12874.1 sugar phosphate isomerase/epimerase [Pseudomonas putida]